MHFYLALSIQVSERLRKFYCLTLANTSGGVISDTLKFCLLWEHIVVKRLVIEKRIRRSSSFDFRFYITDSMSSIDVYKPWLPWIGLLSYPLSYFCRFRKHIQPSRSIFVRQRPYLQLTARLLVYGDSRWIDLLKLT